MRFDPPSSEFPLVEPLTCPFCGALAIPDVVLYNQPYPESILKQAREIFQSADLLVVVGTELKLTTPLIYSRNFAKTGKPVV